MSITDNSPITINELARRIPQLMTLDSLYEVWQVRVAINLVEILKSHPENVQIDQVNEFLTKSFDQFSTVIPSTEDDLCNLADMAIEWLKNPEEFRKFKRARELRFEAIDERYSIRGF